MHAKRLSDIISKGDLNLYKRSGAEVVLMPTVELSWTWTIIGYKIYN